MNDERLQHLADEFGDKIIKGRYSTRRIMRMCKCSENEAKLIRHLARNRKLEDRVGSFTCGPTVWYDQSAEAYVANLPGNKGLTIVAADTHRALLEEYSSLSGSGATVSELSRKFDIPKTTLSKYIKACGITHNSLPVSQEEMSSLGEEGASDLALERLENAIAGRVGREQNRRQKADAEKWQNFEKSVLAPLLDKIEEAHDTYDMPRLDADYILDQRSDGDSFAVVTSPTDLHWGKSSADYDRDIAEERLYDTTHELLRRVLKFGKPDKFYIGVGSDWFHVDNVNYTTTKGVKQDVDGNWEDIFVSGCDLAVKFIDTIRQVAPVSLIMMAGNHDYHSSISLMMYLSAWFRNCEDVEVFRCTEPRQYAVYGSTLMGFTHGDGANGEKLARLMATEAPGSWGKTTHRAFFTGNYHHELVRDYEGVVAYQMPALCGSDRWHKQQGYVGARKSLPAYVVDKKEGIVATVFAPATTPPSDSKLVIS